MPFSVREGINIFLAGFVPTENLRFRDEELSFKLATSTGKTTFSVPWTGLVRQGFLRSVLS
jgi:translation initiation factor RLI1